MSEKQITLPVSVFNKMIASIGDHPASRVFDLLKEVEKSAKMASEPEKEEPKPA